MAEFLGDEDLGPDLFGEPQAPYRDPRGRPKLRISPEMRENVLHLRGMGMKIGEIATHVGCSLPTLRNYFFLELEEGEARTRAQVLLALMSKVREGNVPAIKVALERLQLAGAEPPLPGERPTRASEDEKLGKKASADREAQTAHLGTSWGDLLQ